MKLDLGSGTELKPLTPADAADLYALNRRNRALYRRWTTEWMYRTRTLRSTRTILRVCRKEDRKGTGVLLGIRVEGKLAGLVSLAKIDSFDHCAELGYSLDAAYHGKGLATRAARALADHAFRRMKLHRLELRVNPANRPSLAVARRLGFRRVGLQRERQRLQGSYGDLAVFDLLAREWRR